MPTLAVEDAEKLRAFEQRLQQEGAAAFGAGPTPWEEWNDVGTLGTYRVWRDSARHPPSKRSPRRPLMTRLLTGLAQLAVLVLLIGTAGIYLSAVSTQQQVAGNGIQPPPLVVAGRPARRPASPALPMQRAEPAPLAEAAPSPDPESYAARSDGMPALAAVVPLQLEPVPAPPADSPADEAEPPLVQALEELPVTAAGPAPEPAPATALATGPAPDPAPATALAAGPVPDPAPATALAAEPVPDPAPGTALAAGPVPYLATADAAAGAPAAVAEDPPPQAAPEAAIAAAAEEPAGTPAPADPARELAHTWVVNLASYNYESMAKRKLATFQDKGVHAELAHVTVKDRPMIRLRTTGYKSYREASDWVALLEERLDLQGAWVAKYEPSEKLPAMPDEDVDARRAQHSPE